jgi:hypothetical protein
MIINQDVELASPEAEIIFVEVLIINLYRVSAVIFYHFNIRTLASQPEPEFHRSSSLRF